jgi:Cu2+-exporting ATPase
MAGLLPPLAAGLGMAASSLLVIANSLRLAR